MGFPGGIADAASAIAAALLGLIDDVKIGDMIVSSLTDLSNPSELRITRKPISMGYAITDAAVDVPREITLGICLADPQLSAEALAAAVLNGTVDSLTESWRDKRAYIEQIQTDRELVTVQTHEGVYFNMLLQRIDPIWDVSFNGDALFASCTFVQVNIIDLEDAGGLLDQAEGAAGGL